MSPGRRRLAWAVLLFALVGLLRWPLLDRQGLWADEFFSLAMATGHSLEHPAAEADTTLGDFVESPTALRAGEWNRYLALDPPPAGPRRIVRAVLRSDTSPPLYYILLGYWSRAFGTEDVTLVLFSIMWALASFPLLWLIACRLGGTRAAISAALLYAAVPAGLYYAAEGRMYSLLWFLSLQLMWLTLRLHDRGSSPVRLAAWVVCSAAGFLTHYFFAFPWAACLVWLWLHPGRVRRITVGLAAFGVILLVLPWYLGVPASLRRWRITGYWLDGPLTVRQMIAAPFTLAWDLIAGRGVWGGLKRADRIAQLLIALLGVAALIRRPRLLFRPRARLAWLCLLAVCTGPVVFDLLRGSAASMLPRYALAGLPAAILVLSLALRARRPITNAAALLLLLAAWSPGIRAALRSTSRSWEPYREYAAAAAAWVGPSDLVIIHSIPSGVLGITRYLPPETPVAAWIGQLRVRRVPDDIAALVANRRRIVFIRLHHVGEPAPEEEWLRRHARLVRETSTESSSLLYFAAVTDSLAR